MLTGGPGRPGAQAIGASCAFKFESGRARRHRVLRSTIRGPPARAVRLSDHPTVQVCLPQAAGLPARALELSEWEAGVNSPAGVAIGLAKDL